MSICIYELQDGYSSSSSSAQVIIVLLDFERSS